MGAVLSREKLSAELIAGLSQTEQRGLSHVGKALAHGESLGLDRSTSYRHLIERDAGERIHVVVAAPPDRLEAVTWWFPIVGRVAYRGYFDAEGAVAFQKALMEKGLDTHVRPVLLYSTLGWFDDPIPRRLLSLEPAEIVDTILHELVHETVFVSGDTAYNEGLATFVAHQATLRYFAQDPLALEAAQRRYTDQKLFARLMSDLSRELKGLYQNTKGLDEARRSRERVFRRYQEEVFPSLPWRTGRYRGFTRAELSNAYVLANRAYLDDLACFEAELRELDGNLTGFIRKHREKPGRRRPADECARGDTR
jgi:predicted aminopeptidase